MTGACREEGTLPWKRHW